MIGAKGLTIFFWLTPIHALVLTTNCGFETVLVSLCKLLVWVVSEAAQAYIYKKFYPDLKAVDKE